MLKLVAALLLGSTFLFSQGCCWPMYERHHHRRGGWDDQAGYERAPAYGPRRWAPARD